MLYALAIWMRRRPARESCWVDGEAACLARGAVVAGRRRQRVREAASTHSDDAGLHGAHT
jgi:hypothetical protein